MTVLYFSSTGNCLYVAKEIGGEKYMIPKLISEGKYKIKDEAVGIVVPVYGLCVPPFIMNFIESLEVECDYWFAITTYGFSQVQFVGSLKRRERKTTVNLIILIV